MRPVFQLSAAVQAVLWPLCIAAEQVRALPYLYLLGSPTNRSLRVQVLLSDVCMRVKFAANCIIL